MDLHNYKIVIAYDGTAYSGWQIQPNGITIQELIEKSVETILRSHSSVIGSGRTDAGVHALAQTAHFKTPVEINTYRFLRSLNGLLPSDIRVLSIEEVSLDFHAQYSALSKIYHYHLYLDKIQDPFRRLYSYQIFDKIDLSLLREATNLFKGTHDFTSFANEHHTGTASHDPVRTLYRLDIFDEKGGLRLEFEGDGFLYKMVRNIVGVLVEVAAGKRALNEIPLIFEAKDRKKAGRAVPPHGLFLVEVKYDLEKQALLKRDNGSPHV